MNGCNFRKTSLIQRLLVTTLFLSNMRTETHGRQLPMPSWNLTLMSPRIGGGRLITSGKAYQTSRLKDTNMKWAAFQHCTRRRWLIGQLEEISWDLTLIAAPTILSLTLLSSCSTMCIRKKSKWVTNWVPVMPTVKTRRCQGHSLAWEKEEILLNTINNMLLCRRRNNIWKNKIQDQTMHTRCTATKRLKWVNQSPSHHQRRIKSK